MKALTPFLLSLLASTADAHYRFSKLIVNGVEEAKEWGYVRQTKNYQTNAGVTDVNSADIRCFQNRPGTSTASVQAGTKLGFVAMSAVTHFGPVSFYMAKVPEGRDINTWDGAGNVWFKVGEISAPSSGVLGSGVETWPAYNKKTVEFTIPQNVPNGKYLVRVESIALHQAQSAGGAQVYLSCAQVEVSGGGNGNPSPLVSFPGAYNRNDAGLLWSYYPVRTSYKAPGPAVWRG
ncbi:glycoside hydrolase family 61 protein-like protein [Cladorrhinum samala]|uniref:lytic cellulose monooxygenase (C4-dehydrogenating) n=1 Tax=Cladorrhinum samala TaxID=585594 RepID=A0AAV9HH56_9PEZI|nr:glycoside hydrolase family 61 protein-like protein [Cladorrhinum samala]